jgi:hypothetical protein
MSNEFTERLNKLVDKVAETTKEASDVATDGVSTLWKEFITKGQQAQERVKEEIEKVTKKD